MGRGKLYVCMLALCVYRRLCSRRKGTFKYMELEQQPQFDIIYIHEIFDSVFILLSLSYTLLNTFLSQLLWEWPECEGSRPLYLLA